MTDRPLVSARGVRLQDIARTLKLSASTVSRALAGSEAISEDTRAAVRKTAVDMGYLQASAGARRRPPATRTIGVVMGVSELQNRFMTQLLEEIHQALRELGYHAVVLVDSMNTRADVNEQLAALRPLIEQQLEGVIVGSPSLDSALVPELRRLGIPQVLVVRSVEGEAGAGVDVVEADNVRGGAEAARHVLELGHRRIALIMGPRNTSPSRDRTHGALQALQAHGIGPEDVPLTWNAYTSEAGYSCTVELLGRDPAITAIVCGNDAIALGVLEAARSLNIEVPARLSVVGFDDIPIARSPLVRLTTVQHPVREMGRTAARRVVERIQAGPEAPAVHDRFPTQLIRRDTTAPPPSRRQD